jgi:hypothetical protein
MPGRGPTFRGMDASLAGPGAVRFPATDLPVDRVYGGGLAVTPTRTDPASPPADEAVDPGTPFADRAAELRKESFP